MAKWAAASSGRRERFVDDSVTECRERGKFDDHRIRAAACNRLCCTIGGRHAWHGIRRDVERRAVDHRPPAGARERAGPHRRGFHHGGLGGFAHLSSQRGLADGGAPRRDRRAGRDPGRLDSVQYRDRRRAPPRLRLSAADGTLHSLAIDADRAHATNPGRLACAARAARRISRRYRRWRVGTGDHLDAHRLGACAASDNTTEFFVTVAAAATFFAELGASPLQHLIPLVLGGVLAAPIGGWAVKHVPALALMIAVGLLIVTLSIFQLLRAFRVI